MAAQLRVLLLRNWPSDRNQRSNGEPVRDVQQIDNVGFLGREECGERSSEALVPAPEQHVLQEWVDRTSADDAWPVEVLVGNGEGGQFYAEHKKDRHIDEGLCKVIGAIESLLCEIFGVHPCSLAVVVVSDDAPASVFEISVPLTTVELRHLALEVTVTHDHNAPALTIAAARSEPRIVEHATHRLVIDRIVGEVSTRGVGAHCRIEFHAPEPSTPVSGH